MAKLDISKIDTKPTYKKKIAEATAEETYSEKWEQMPLPGLEFLMETQPKQEAPLAQEKQEEQDIKKIYKDRKTYTPDETEEALAFMKTQGRKGIKLPRINTAYTPENYYYAKVMAGVTGTSVTDFINICIQEHREAHKELFDKAKEIKRSL